MALAWLYATAAVNFFEKTLAELENRQIDAWMRNKAYQKMRESRRFTPRQQQIILKNKRASGWWLGQRRSYLLSLFLLLLKFSAFINYEKPKNIIIQNSSKHLQNIDEFLVQINSFDDYITWKKRDEILKKYEKTHNFFQGKSKYYKKEPRVRQFNGLYENFAEFIKSYNQK